MAGNAEYVINIASELSGDETLAELDELTSELMGAGRGAEFFQQAIQRVSRDLEAAASAAASANADLADGNATYRALEVAANQAAKTVERLGLKGDVMSRAYLEAARASSDASAALGTHAVKLAGLESAAAGAAARERELADTLKGVTKVSSHVDKSIADQAKEWRVLSGVLGDLPGPLGKVARSFAAGEAAEARFAGRFGEDAGMALKLGLGIAGVTAAAVALTAALAVGAVKVALWAVSLADASRNAELAVEAMQVMTPELAGMSGLIADVSKETGMTAVELNTLAGSLLDAGKSADQMEDSLRAAAFAQTALGAKGAASYMKLVQAATDAQKAVDEAAAKSGGAVDKKLTTKLEAANAALGDFEQKAVVGLGGVVARQMQGVGAQSERFQTNIAKLFGGLDIDPALAGLSKLVDLFDENSASGKAIKFIFETVFQPLINGADDAATAVEAFVLGFMIGAMKLYLALRPAIKAIEEFFGLDGSELEIDFKSITAIGEALAPVFLAVAAVIGGVLLVAFAAVAAIVASQIAVWYSLYKAGELVYDMFVAIIDGVMSVADAVVEAFRGIIEPVVQFFMGEIDLSTAAVRIVMGFVNGVLGVGNAVLGAFMGIWSSVVTWFSGLPFGQMGIDLIRGFVGGITGGAGAVVSAVTNVMRGALNAAKSVLGIASPSKETEELAGFTVSGFTNEIDDSTPDVQAGMAEMLAVPPANDVLPNPAEQLKQAQLAGDTDAIARLQGATSPADSGAPPQAPGAGDSAGGGASFGPGAVFNFYGLPDAKGAQDAFQEMLDAAVEGDAAKLGAAAARGKTAA
jgi:hypothetical protein